MNISLTLLMHIYVTRVTGFVKTGYVSLAKSSKSVPAAKASGLQSYSYSKGAWIAMRQEVRNKKKQSRTRPSNSAIHLKPGLLNLDQILIAQGILTQSSDRQAVARALGLADRNRPADSIFERTPSR
jgi:hypothetical protein